MRDRAYLALRRYRPRYYPGKIKFVKAETISEFPDDPAAVWTNLAKELEIETVPGDHLGIVNTHYERLAAVLSRYLQEAIDGK
jgi:thioesterase domain-containing protein